MTKIDLIKKYLAEKKRLGEAAAAFAAVVGVPFAAPVDLSPADCVGLVDGETIDIDLLVAKDAENNERASLNIISAGFDAAVCKGQERVKKLPLVSGKSAYNISLVKSVFTKTKHYFVLKVDGQRFGDSAGPYLFAIAANGKYYGGGFKASPYSDISDGVMEFIRIDTVSPVKLLSLVGKFREGRHIEELKDIVATKQCKSMQFVSDKPIDINLDGEIVPMKNPTIRILHHATKIILPKNED
jgi:diacylglycerol kinase family enzyme